MDALLKLDQFEGPLDLLLQLIEQEELNITDISLSKITEQFFSHLDRMGKDHPSELTDFLVIAARLVYLKSRTLLPYLYPEEQESGQELVDQLKMYKRYVEASKDINNFWTRGNVSYGRIEPPVKSKEFVLPLNASSDNLLAAVRRLLFRLKPVAPLPRVAIDYSVSIKERLDSIRDLLRRAGRVKFLELLEDAGNRTEVIVSFLALLDLVQQKQVLIRQEEMFGELEIENLKF